MLVPSDLRLERSTLWKQSRGTRFWWLYRAMLTFILLQGPLKPLIERQAWWSFPAAVGIWTGTVLMWWLAAVTLEAERARIERKVSRGVKGGWRGVLPMALVALVFLLVSLPPQILDAQSITLRLVVFGALIFVVEQTFAAKRASFELLDAREQVLQAKLAPHFIFNVLNTLHAQIEQDPRGAQATTERLAQLFRQVIAVADKPSIPLKQELEFIEAYLGIEQARLGRRLRVAIEVPEELDSAEIPPLSLQVLVENAVKHGVAPLELGGEIRIGAARRGATLRVWVEDPGTGASPEKGTGTALETLRQRLERPDDLSMGLMEGRHRVAFQWRQA